MMVSVVMSSATRVPCKSFALSIYEGGARVVASWSVCAGRAWEALGGRGRGLGREAVLLGAVGTLFLHPTT